MKMEEQVVVVRRSDHSDDHQVPISPKVVVMKPSKVRIIHIFTPQIINTDVSNFRELVQTLTGKPPPPQGNGDNINKKKRSTRSSISSWRSCDINNKKLKRTSAVATATSTNNYNNNEYSSAAMQEDDHDHGHALNDNVADAKVMNQEEIEEWGLPSSLSGGSFIHDGFFTDDFKGLFMHNLLESPPPPTTSTSCYDDMDHHLTSLSTLI